MNFFKVTKASDDKPSFTALVAATPKEVKYPETATDTVNTKYNGTTSSSFVSSGSIGTTGGGYHCYQCGHWVYGNNHICLNKQAQAYQYPYYVSPNLNGIESKLERIARALESLVHFESVKDLNAKTKKAKDSIKKVLKKKKG